MRGLHGSENPDAKPDSASTGSARARLRHRLPVRLRHHWKAAAVVAAALLALVLVFGEVRVRPYITSELASDEEITDNIEGEGDLFDGGEHSIEVTFDEDEYADMMSTFREEGEKQYIRADITVDGTVVDDVALRLKGNSTLSSLGGSGALPEVPVAGEGQEDGQEEGGTRGGGGPGMVTLSEDEPENLPWLISFDEYSSGRAYQGHTEVTLRPAANGSDTAVNEALALELTAADGQGTQEYAFTSFSVNDGDAVPRLLLDSPDAGWAASLGDGVLYKGRADGSFDYLGGDPTDYEGSFNQINGEGTYDLQPVMNLLEFVEEADDEEFADDLDEYVDTESFARYLALQNLVSNQDAMDGPGNNYYLWYDLDEERFTVLSWDLNMSFSTMGGMVPGSEGTEDAQASEDTGNEFAEGVPQVPGGDDGEAAEGREDMGQTGRGSGALKERFLDNDDFREQYEQAYADLYQDLVADGSAARILEDVVARAEAAGDGGASATAETLDAQIGQISAEPGEETGMFPGGGGRDGGADGDAAAPSVGDSGGEDGGVSAGEAPR